MAYTVLTAIFVILALVIVLFAARMLLRGSWLLGWLRGMVGLSLIAVAVVLTMAALDFHSYKQLAREQTVATLGFTRIAPQQFQVSVVDDTGIEEVYEVYGDLWQLDARIIKWSNSLAGIGLTPGYRLDRLSGRYFSLEKEQKSTRSVHQLGTSKSLFDTWNWLREYGSGLAMVDASYGSATYLPMEDGALFAVNLTNSGLIARPLNDRARTAVENWQ